MRRSTGTTPTKQHHQQLPDDDSISVDYGPILKTKYTPQLMLQILIWYLAGVSTISTSKMILLKTPAPLMLSFTQFLTGACILYFYLSRKRVKSLAQTPQNNLTIDTIMKRGSVATSSTRLQSVSRGIRVILAQTSICFCLGFVLTNFSFNTRESASFVETVKSSEPLTSALCSYLFSIDTVSYNEVASLLVIVSGIGMVIVSNQMPADAGGGSGIGSSTGAEVGTIVMVFGANLCFSLRGMYQSKMRQGGSVSEKATNKKDVNVVGKGKRTRKKDGFQQLDDMNLFFRMQQFGCMLIFPLLLLVEGWGFVKFLYRFLITGTATTTLSDVTQICGLLIFNAICYTMYTLASTSVLTQVNLMEHAALNALRRLFAIIVTSFVFSTIITKKGFMGIGLTVGGFLLFMTFKNKRRLRAAKLMKSGSDIDSKRDGGDAV